VAESDRSGERLCFIPSLLISRKQGNGSTILKKFYGRDSVAQFWWLAGQGWSAILTNMGGLIMRMNDKTPLGLACLIAAVVILFGAAVNPANAELNLIEALTAGKPDLFLRYRFEHVEDGIPGLKEAFCLNAAHRSWLQHGDVL
jgi:hypothetical protein